MSVAPSLGIPELAGLGTYEEAARVGFSVDENVTRLLRYQWAERRLMAIMAAHLPATPIWEVKGALGLHLWQAAEHVEALRQRVGEMRHPVPSLDTPPDPDLDQFFEELLRSGDVVELVTGIYRVTIPALAAAYRGHLEATNVLVDHPTRRVLRFALLELEEGAAWGERALAALLASDPGARPVAEQWAEHLDAWLRAARGIAGDGDVNPAEALPPARSTEPFQADLEPRRDERFRGTYNFVFPPQDLYPERTLPADERNLALLAKRTLEMDVPELMASVMVERTDLPWEFHREYARQLWDEVRHAMMGSVAFEAKGIDWTEIPLNVGFSLRLNLHATPLERQTMLFGIEQSLMPADTGKRYEYEIALEAGDPLSAHFQDYDWADEVLHAQIGRRWLKREGIGADEAIRRATGIHERTWGALDAYRGRAPQVDWWDGFVRRVLGHGSAYRPVGTAAPRVLSE
jgi:hypothetical protein